MKFVREAIEEVGAENVIQTVTNGAANNMKVSTILALKKSNLFCTTCAADKINLILVDLPKSVLFGMLLKWRDLC